MSADSAVTVTGQVMEVEHRQGAFTNDQSEHIAYDFHLVHVHLGGANILAVKVKNDNADLPLPKTGDRISVEVDLPKGTRPLGKRYAASK